MIDIIVACSIGLGLAAACGFRVFVPMLAIGIAARGDYLTLADGFEWIESWPAIGALSVATVLEIGAYYFPWLDNLLDTAATPAAVVAGSVASASVAPEMSPFLKWSLVIIAGGGSAGVIHAGLAMLRAGSSATTGGVANPLVATGEWIGSIIMSVLAVFLPIIAAVVGLVAVVVSILLARRFWTAWTSRHNRKRASSDNPATAESKG